MAAPDGIAWIGASFYFVMLDNSLKPPKRAADAERGVGGELWAVHGGGFYVSQKFPVGPKGEPLSEDLHWSKWEAYTTWMSGMGLLAIIYWWSAGTYLIDRNVMPLTPAAAIAISIGSLVGGWFVYDALCRILKGRDGLLAILLVLVMAAAYALFHVSSARGLHSRRRHSRHDHGRECRASHHSRSESGGRDPCRQGARSDAGDHRQAALGAQHVLHAAGAVHDDQQSLPDNPQPSAWLAGAGADDGGRADPQFFVLRHGAGAKPWLLLVAAVLLAGLVVWLAPSTSVNKAAVADYLAVRKVLDQRCVSCHAAQPKHEGFAQPPKGVMVETPEQVAQHAAKIAETVANRYMPIGNLTQMTDDERAIVAQWFAAGAKVQ